MKTGLTRENWRLEERFVASGEHLYRAVSVARETSKRKIGKLVII